MNRRQNHRLLKAFALEQDATVLAEDVVLLDQAQERSFYGREAVITFLNTFFIHGFTQTEAKVQTMIIDEMEAALVFTFYGRQDGAFMGLPPTRQEVVVPMVLICREELRNLLKDAGFQRLEIEPASMTTRFPDPEGFLAGEIDVDTAAIPSMQHLDAQARQAITAAIREDMEGPLRQVTEGDYVVLPFHAQIVRAEG